MAFDFPIKDLVRRKLQTVMTTLNLAVCVAMTTFFILFGENLGAGLSSATTGKLTVGLSVVLSRFTLIVVVLNSLAGILVTSFLVSIMTSGRIRDIGIMKAVGCLTDMVFAFFTTELSLITIAGCILGTIFGVIANSISVWLMNMIGFYIQPKPLNAWTIILVFILFASLTHILGIWQIIKTIRVKPVDALSQIFTLGTTRRSGRWIPSRLGLTVKIALRSLARRRSQTVQMVICLSMIITLMTLSIFGGTVAKETTQIYIERAIGRNVLLIAEAEMAEQYADLLSRFFEPKEARSIDYLDQDYTIPDSLISGLESIDGIMKIDPRLILETMIYEYPTVVPDPEGEDRYIEIGDHRTCRVIAMGVNPNQVVNDWLILGRKLEETEPNSALIGNSVALKTFDNALEQIFKMSDLEFNITGVCIDPMNNGEVIYAPIPTLSSLHGEHGYNLLLLQIDSRSRPETLSRIEAKINETDLVFLDLTTILDSHIRFLDYTWSMVLPLSLSSLINAVFCLSGYMALALMSQRRDLGIMRALGAKPSNMIKMLFSQSLMLVIISGMVGVSLGLVVTFTFFIPEATISQASLPIVAGSILLVLGLMSISGVYPAMNITRKSTGETIRS
jgi:ABC-type antimicrobial peptide transport system permease subunit